MSSTTSRRNSSSVTAGGPQGSLTRVPYAPRVGKIAFLDVSILIEDYAVTRLRFFCLRL
jgi:hypothetical protein